MINVSVSTFLIALAIAYIIPLAVQFSRRPALFSAPLALYAALIISIAITSFFIPQLAIAAPKTAGIFLAATLVLLVSIAQSRGLLPERWGLLGLGVAAAILIFSGIRLSLLFLPSFINIVLTVLWILAVSKSFAILSSLRGLACGTALIVSFILFSIAFATDNILQIVAWAALAGALVGVLRHSFRDHSIELAQGGGLLLGFIISALSMDIDYCKPFLNWAGFLSPLLILGLPLYSLAGWAWGKESFFARLQALGYAAKQILLIAYSLSVFLGIVALVMMIAGQSYGLIAFLLALAIIAILHRLLFKERPKTA